MIPVATQETSEPAPLFEARAISKAFGHVQALTDVSFTLRAGEVLALLGDNGAGKVDADQGRLGALFRGFR